VELDTAIVVAAVQWARTPLSELYFSVAAVSALSVDNLLILMDTAIAVAVVRWARIRFFAVS